MPRIVCSSVRVKLHARAKLIFLREQPDDFFSVGNPVIGYNKTLQMFYIVRNRWFNFRWGFVFKSHF